MSASHNPDRLKPADVGPGYRLLTVDERRLRAAHTAARRFGSRPKNAIHAWRPVLRKWDDRGVFGTGWYGDSPTITYRTKLSVTALRRLK